MKPKKKSWLKPRGYIHFTKKFKRNDHNDIAFLHSYVSNPASIASHSFFPLIHRPIVTRRYKRVPSINEIPTQRKHSYIDSVTGKQTSNAKLRHIFYSTHIDAYIYSYYCQEILSPLYETKVSRTPGLSDCISAYRKIPVNSNLKRNKSNIHFADDVFKFIKSYGDCIAMTFDVSAFFDSLNQAYLKKQWSILLGAFSLPKDHYNIYKSLTRASFVEYYAVLKQYDIKNQNKLRGKKHISFCNDANEFRHRVRKRGLIKKHPHKNKVTGEYIGIPQGTPISAFLSNLYLFEFDSIMFNQVQLTKKGMYRRYSDDIIIVCKRQDADFLKHLVLTTIENEFSLSINSDKVSTSSFHESHTGLTCDVPLIYLGFEFDGERALIKSASIAKFYRQMKKAVKAQGRKACHNMKHKGDQASTAKIYKHDLYKSYSHLGTKGRDRNFYVYAKEAARIMTEPAIKEQLSMSWVNLNAEIKKYETKYGLK